jgi:hypothetical protein
MTAARDLTGLIARGRITPPDRTVAAPPPRRRTAEREKSPADPMVAEVAPSRMAAAPKAELSMPPGRRRKPRSDKPPGTRQSAADPPTTTTTRISVNIPLGCKQWLAHQAREQQRFVSEIVMEALDRHGDGASPPSGRAKRVAVPDGTIYDIVLPAQDRQRLDDIVARKGTTRSALLTDVLDRARSW